MTACFIVLTHKEPDQIARLTNRLSGNNCFVHVDSAVPENKFREFEQRLSHFQHVELIDRKRSAWASWGIVEASLEGVRQALRKSDWTHVMVLSGQDYPLYSVAKMSSFLSEHAHLNFVPNWKLPHPVWGKHGGMDRVLYKHYPISGRKFFIPFKRKINFDLEFYGGSMFWCITRAAAEYLINFVDSQPEVVNFFKNVWIPDELFVPTVLLNSPFAQSCINENLTYISWNKRGDPHPATLSKDHFQELMKAKVGQSDKGGKSRAKLFGRKFDLHASAVLMNMLDNND